MLWVYVYVYIRVCVYKCLVTYMSHPATPWCFCRQHTHQQQTQQHAPQNKHVARQTQTQHTHLNTPTPPPQHTFNTHGICLQVHNLLCLAHPLQCPFILPPPLGQQRQSQVAIRIRVGRLLVQPLCCFPFATCFEDTCIVKGEGHLQEGSMGIGGSCLCCFLHCFCLQLCVSVGGCLFWVGIVWVGGYTAIIHN